MTCPNCGNPFDGERCPNCGRPAQGAKRFLAVLLVVFLVLPCAAMGACSALMGVDAMSRGDSGSALFQALLFGFAALCGLAATLYAVVELWRN